MPARLAYSFAGVLPGSNFKLLELNPVLVLPLAFPPDEGGGLMEKLPFLNEPSVFRRLSFGLRSHGSRGRNIYWRVKKTLPCMKHKVLYSNMGISGTVYNTH